MRTGCLHKIGQPSLNKSDYSNMRVNNTGGTDFFGCCLQTLALSPGVPEGCGTTYRHHCHRGTRHLMITN